MVMSIARKLTDMKDERDTARNLGRRDLVVLKSAVVETEMAKLGLELRQVRRPTRMVSPTAYDAGGVAGASLPIHAGIQGRND